MVYVSTFGVSSWDFKKAAVDVAIAIWDWGAYINEKALTEGIRVKTSSYTRHHVNVNMTKSKANGNYLNFALARGEALRMGFDEALLLDMNGFVAEGPVENIFLVKRGEIITPYLAYILRRDHPRFSNHLGEGSRHPLPRGIFYSGPIVHSG